MAASDGVYPSNIFASGFWSLEDVASAKFGNNWPEFQRFASNVSVLLIGGGGTGPGGNRPFDPPLRAGGGGAGGFLEIASFSGLSGATTYTVTVGGSDSNSEIFISGSPFILRAVGGGGGRDTGAYSSPGGPGGSGGGAGAWYGPYTPGVTPPINGGAGIQPIQTGSSGAPFGFGNWGANNTTFSSGFAGPGGGAGATGLAGGTGRVSNITGSSNTYSAGGSAGGSAPGVGNSGNGGNSGFGETGIFYPGGSGIVVLRHSNTFRTAIVTGSNVTTTESSGQKIYIFRASGTITL